VGSTCRSSDGIAQQSPFLVSSSRPHVRDPDRTSRPQVLPVPGLQEAEPHRPELHHIPADAYDADSGPLDPAWRRRSLRHQVDDTL